MLRVGTYGTISSLTCEISFAAAASASRSNPMIALDGYLITDGFFGAPYVDADEERDAPLRHRYLHGGFVGTDTRFSLYFPD
jgi:hypothetical protein